MMMPPVVRKAKRFMNAMRRSWVTSASEARVEDEEALFLEGEAAFYLPGTGPG